MLALLDHFGNTTNVLTGKKYPAKH